MKLGNCIQPWYEFQFDYHDQLRPCCYYSGELEKIKFNINESWNSKYFKNVRKIITNNNLKDDNGCSNCDYLKITGTIETTFDQNIPKNIQLTDNISKKVPKLYFSKKRI